MLTRIRKIVNPPYSGKDFLFIFVTLLILVAVPITVIAVRVSRDLKGRASETGGLINTFQPSAPYYATFFYPWYANPNTDGSWGHWQEGGHTPASNWASNFIPDLNPARFDPNTELYSSNSDLVLLWQMKKMAEAKIEVAISSWWGPGDGTDKTLSHIIKGLMNNPGNTYPNLRWTPYYEKEANGNPTVSEIINDLNYISTNYANEPAMLKINGKPVIFVYGAGIDGADMVNRWSQVRKATNFYIVLQVFQGYENYQNQVDSWHQYDPTVRGSKHGSYSTAVSPGFWKYGQNPILPRNLSEFKYALSLMVLANTQWKLIETWNEWLEGTSVEPGEQVIQTNNGSAVLNTNGVPFKNGYIDALREVLPALENGVGSKYVDSDGDSFNDYLETYLGTKPTSACGINSWPLDFNNDKKVTLEDLTNFLAPIRRLDTKVGDANFSKRFDLNQDGQINQSDLQIIQNNYNKTCQ